MLAGAAHLPAARPAARPHGKTAVSLRPRIELFDDGGFDIEAAGLALRGGYPAIDDVPVRALAVRVERTNDGGRITYTLPGGILSLGLGIAIDPVTGVETAFIDTELTGFHTAPHWVFPLAGARVRGADRFFKQGLGFGGPSGLFPFPRAGKTHTPNSLTDAAWSYDSYLTSALVAPSGATLAIAALAHHDYLQRTTFHNHAHRRELVDKKPAGDEWLIEAGFSTERIALPDHKLRLPRLHVFAGARTYATLQTVARTIARAHAVKVRQPARFFWNSWYEFYEGHDLVRLQDTLAGFSRVTPRLPFQSAVIDAGPQSLGDWLEIDERLYPGGIEAMFGAIARAGVVPGIWVGTFMVSSNSRVYREHPEWMVRDLDGKPLLHGKGKPLFYSYHSHEERYYLDTSHPGAFAYLREVFRTYRRLGVRTFKLDFMEWGFKDSTTVRRHTPGKTSTQYLVDVLRMIREEIGPDSFLLGCITPFAPMIGFADGMRVAYDVDTDAWKGDGTVNMLNETMATQYMNGILWQNDPDVLFVRDGTGGMRMNADEVQSIALWDGILGGVVTTSDRPHRLPPDRLALLRFVQPGKRPGQAVFPLWGAAERRCRVPVRAYPDRQAFGVLILNPTDQPVEERFPLTALIGRETGFVYRWRPGQAARLGRKAEIAVTLQAHQSELLWIGAQDAPPPADLGLCGEPVGGLAPDRPAPAIAGAPTSRR